MPRQRLFVFMKEMPVLTVRQARRRGVLVAVVIALSTGGCSSVPDEMNPVEWYKDTSDWVSGDDKVDAADQPAAKPIPGAEKSFPKLGSVPARPPQSTAAEREQMANELLADRKSARYTDEQIRRQDNSVAAGSLPRPPAQPSVAGAGPVQAATAPRQAVVPNQTAAGQGAFRPVSGFPARSASAVPVMPNQPIPVIPNQPVAVPSTPPQAVQLPTVPSMTPPPPPVIAGDSAPPPSAFPPNAFPPRPLGFPELPSEANPSGGGPAYSRPAPPAQQNSNSFGADRFPPRFRNEPAPAIAPAFEPSPSLQPNGLPVATILFRDGSARIGSGDRLTIRQVYNDYRTRGGRIHVVGHSSSRTRNLDQASHQLANFSISYARARSVAQVLEQLGVPPETIMVTAMSDHQQAFVEVMPAGEAGNRRAEIYFEN